MQPDNTIRISRTSTLTLIAPHDVVFPLFCPDGERNWAPEWNPQPVYPTTIQPEEGAVFTTAHSGDQIWVMTRHEPSQGLIEYVNFRPGTLITHIAIRVSPSSQGSHAQVTYTLTALSDQGQHRVARFTQLHYAEMMAHWEHAINSFLAACNSPNL
jgi:hypothetical protein